VARLHPPTRERLRTTVLFVAGLAGIGYETVVQSGERPTLLILFAAMVGLPAFLSADERRKNHPPPADGQTVGGVDGGSR
jgi:hypothetical protein